MSDIELQVKSLVREINAQAISRADRGLNFLRNAALEVLGRNGTGRRYGAHVASSPGQPPAPDKGNLRKNWSQEKQITGGNGNLRIVLKIKSRMFYATYLQHGTRKMSARPFKEPIRQKARPQIARLYSDL